MVLDLKLYRVDVDKSHGLTILQKLFSFSKDSNTLPNNMHVKQNCHFQGQNKKYMRLVKLSTG